MTWRNPLKPIKMIIKVLKNSLKNKSIMLNKRGVRKTLNQNHKKKILYSRVKACKVILKAFEEDYCYAHYISLYFPIISYIFLKIIYNIVIFYI